MSQKRAYGVSHWSKDHERIYSLKGLKPLADAYILKSIGIWPSTQGYANFSLNFVDGFFELFLRDA